MRLIKWNSRTPKTSFYTDASKEASKAYRQQEKREVRFNSWASFQHNCKETSAATIREPSPSLRMTRIIPTSIKGDQTFTRHERCCISR
ncbi:hypothetical protein EV1_042278 [Malus domestica]